MDHKAQVKRTITYLGGGGRGEGGGGGWTFPLASEQALPGLPES